MKTLVLGCALLSPLLFTVSIYQGTVIAEKDREIAATRVIKPVNVNEQCVAWWFNKKSITEVRKRICGK